MKHSDQPEAQNLQRYFSRTHVTNPASGRQQQLLTCTVCNKMQTSRLSNMLEHVKTHFKSTWPYKCERCGKGFIKQWNRDCHYKYNICQN